MNNKLELLKQTKKLVGKKDITTLIKESKLLYQYLNSEYDIISRLTELKFFNNFVKEFSILNPLVGMVSVEYRSFYDEIIKALENNNIVSVQNKRQQGMTTFCILYALFYAINNPNKTIMFGCVKKFHADDVSQTIDTLYSSITENIFPSIVKWNNRIKKFDNGSKIILESITPTMTRGLSVNQLILDCSSYVSYRYTDDIIETLWPTIATGGKILSCSDWDGIEHKDNLFCAIKNKSQKFIDIRNM